VFEWLGYDPMSILKHRYMLGGPWAVVTPEATPPSGKKCYYHEFLFVNGVSRPDGSTYPPCKKGKTCTNRHPTSAQDVSVPDVRTLRALSFAPMGVRQWLDKWLQDRDGGSQ